MKSIKAEADRVHAKRHAPLGMKSTSKHPGYASEGGGVAAGGSIHGDAAQDRSMIRKMVKPEALNRASGGKVKKKKGDTQVNILIGQPSQPSQQGPTPVPVPVPMGAPPAGQMGARPPMPPAGGVPPGIGGVAGPMRKRGGSVKRG